MTVYILNGKRISEEEFRKTVDKSKLTNMLRERKFPGIRDDTTFMAKRGTLADQLGPDLELVVKAAQEEGYTPSMHDVYLPSLADHIGDRRAFIKQDGACGQVRKVCEDRGLACHGSVEVKAPKKEEQNEQGLGDDIVIESFLEMSKSDPKLKHASKDEIRQEVNKIHGGLK